MTIPTDPFANPPRRATPDPFANPPRYVTPGRDANPGREGPRPARSSVLASRRRARIAALVVVVAVAVLAIAVWAGVTISRSLIGLYAAPVVTAGPGPARPDPVVTPPAREVTAAMTPDGWERRASPGAGGVAFAFDPSWTEVVDSPEDRQFREDALAAAGENPDDAVLLLGHWERAASATMPAVSIRVVEDPLAGREGDLKTIVEEYTIKRAAVAGDDDPERFYSGEYVHPLGYEGWRVTMWAHANGETTALDVTGIRYRDAVVFASMSTDGYPVPIDAVPASVVFLPND